MSVATDAALLDELTGPTDGLTPAAAEAVLSWRGLSSCFRNRRTSRSDESRDR